MKEYTGVDLPNLIGCTVRMNVGVTVEGVIESISVKEYIGDFTRVKFASVTENSHWGRGYSDLKKNYYNVQDFDEVIVLAGNSTDIEEDNELVLFFAGILAEHRLFGSTSLALQDLRQARAVVEAIEKLVNDDA